MLICWFQANLYIRKVPELPQKESKALTNIPMNLYQITWYFLTCPTQLRRRMIRTRAKIKMKKQSKITKKSQLASDRYLLMIIQLNLSITNSSIQMMKNSS